MTELATDYGLLRGGAGALAIERDVVRVSGPEAVGYLQGQCSQDIAAVAVGASAWSLVLQPQGKVDAWVRVTRQGDEEVLLDVDGGFGEALLARLARFKLRVKADLELLDWRCVAVRGPGVPAADVPPGAEETGVAFEWNGFAGFDLLGPDPVAPAGVALVGGEAYEVRRIEAGLPRMGAELTDKTIPAEAGIVEASVDFAKGCYTGQELVARIDSRGGNVPRRLRGLVLEGVPEVGSDVEVGGKKVGALTSVARHPAGHGVGLGYIGRDVPAPAEAVCGGVAASVRTLPLLS
jgi:tRNA-modifying protein YgfZ